jgi:hypothetical protein
MSGIFHRHTEHRDCKYNMISNNMAQKLEEQTRQVSSCWHLIMVRRTVNKTKNMPSF